MRFPLSIALALVSSFAGAETIRFSHQIRPILSEYCFACHGPDEAKREGGLRLDDEKAAKSNRDGVTAIVPGDPAKSAIIAHIESTDPDEVMPPPKQHKVMPPAQIALLKEWIKQGAPWGKHWSYETVQRPPVPWPAKPKSGSEIDAFIYERLAKEGMDFAAEADRPTLIRRLSLDLTGLPPTLEELNKLNPAKPLNFFTLIEHFLAKPAYGEHWARLWLDLARYADSSGYPSDQPREIWSYRDWVIKAFNANMPYDQFTIEQLAGDLLPKPSEDQLIATAFHRNTMTQNEGGTSDEEFRTAAIVDRVNTTMAVWMGTSMACAQCHTHKYDPITNKEYFQFYDILNQTADADKKDEAPFIEMWKPGQQEQLDKLKKDIATANKPFATPKPEWLAGFDEWLAKPHPEIKEPKPIVTILALKPEQRTPAHLKSLKDHYVRQVTPAAKAERDKLAALNKQLAAIKALTVPVMKDLPEKEHRVTKVQLRGNWQALGEEVHADTPAIFPPMPKDRPRDRLAMAQWIIDKRNPLTARVMVNRMWEQIFGQGIVRTVEEFGAQGDLPSHPELLDWLAAEFMESGWDIKHLITLMVSSRTYRQVTGTHLTSDDTIRRAALYSFGPRFRPTGELIRDQALAVSGLLSSKMFGPPVRPLTPSLGLTTAFGRSNDWVLSEGEDKHRRSVYTEVRRNSPYASFMTFDATNRETCTLRRNRTNTPLQAFVTLNDPVFIECAQALARTLIKDKATTADRLSHLFALCLARAPSAEESSRLTALLDAMRADYKADATAAKKLATEPLGPLPAGADPVDHAAWTTVANLVMNLDEFLVRR